MTKQTPQPFVWLLIGFAALSLISPLPALAQEDDNGLSAGDTAWMLTATALVLFMTLPGLALFYGGLVRAKNILSVLMQCFFIAALMTVLWVVVGYSIALGDGASSWWGGLGQVMLAGVDRASMADTFPETVWITFQLTFAIITPALIVGAFAERMKFAAVALFMGMWMLLVYAPICYWVWGGNGFIDAMGAYDFAGGTVVHINAGVAALVACIVLGPRKGYPGTPMPPHSLPLAVIGASMLWVGWFGFNAGSAGAANGDAGMAMLITQICCATAALSWAAVEWLQHGKTSVLGTITGAVAGLVAITPASGFTGPLGALLLGIMAGVICYYSATALKRALRYDDSLDVFGVHGVGGLIGAIMTGVFCHEFFGGVGFNEEANITSMGGQLYAQVASVVITIVYSGIASFILLKITDVVVGLRINEEGEDAGLDISEHNERGYNL